MTYSAQYCEVYDFHGEAEVYFLGTIGERLGIDVYGPAVKVQALRAIIRDVVGSKDLDEVLGLPRTFWIDLAEVLTAHEVDILAVDSYKKLESVVRSNAEVVRLCPIELALKIYRLCLGHFGQGVDIGTGLPYRDR